MTYVVDENCIRCKIMDCVEVCPVDCFYEGENMLVIHPDECIDCGFACRNAQLTRSSRTGEAREMVAAECRIRESLAKHYDEKNASA